MVEGFVKIANMASCLSSMQPCLFMNYIATVSILVLGPWQVFSSRAPCSFSHIYTVTYNYLDPGEMSSPDPNGNTLQKLFLKKALLTLHYLAYKQSQPTAAQHCGLVLDAFYVCYVCFYVRVSSPLLFGG